MKKITLLFCLISTIGYSQNNFIFDGWDEPRKGGARVAFYNVENLFDTENDSLTRDDDFTPEGRNQWTYYRYREKVNKLAKAIKLMGGWEAPEILGLCEVENRTVLEDLINNPVLKPEGYEILHFDSPDGRGIDVAMVYKPKVFTLLFAQPIAVKNPDDPGFKTRDVLYAKGLLGENDTLHLFFNHWPSRYGGSLQSEPLRILASEVVKQKLDSLDGLPYAAPYVVSGDFNDDPGNSSMKKLLQGFENQRKNLMTEQSFKTGTLKFQGRWFTFDQIIVSAQLLTNHGLRINGPGAVIFDHPLLLEEEARIGVRPYRYYRGPFYHGGFSDHLPIFVDIYWEETKKAAVE